MMKSVKKKLKKFWLKKKKKKKTITTHYNNEYYPPPPPSTCHHCCCSYSSSKFQPSAPPLPSWLDTDPTLDAILPPFIQPGSGHIASSSDQAHHFPAQDIVSETCPAPINSTSYQQYMVSNPVYGVPIAASPVRREKSAGFFGFVAKIGNYLFRCFCPCFRVEKVY